MACATVVARRIRRTSSNTVVDGANDGLHEATGTAIAEARRVHNTGHGASARIFFGQTTQTTGLSSARRIDFTAVQDGAVFSVHALILRWAGVHTDGLAFGVWAVNIGRRRVRTRHTQVISVTTLGRAGRIRRRTLCCRIPPGGTIAQRTRLVGVGTTGHDLTTRCRVGVTEGDRGDIFACAVRVADLPCRAVVIGRTALVICCIIAAACQ